MALRSLRAAVLLAAVLLAAAASASAATYPANFQEDVAFGPFPDNVSAIRFAPFPDTRVFVVERGGVISVYDSLTDTTPTQLADLRTQVQGWWDRGMLGFAVHPNFPATPYVYASYSHDAAIGGTAPRWGDTCPTPPGATNDGCVISGRLSRLQVNPLTNTLVGGEQVLIEDWCQQYPSHSTGDLGFGADGMLYASAGDGASFNFADYGQDGSPRNPCGDPPAGVGGAMTAPTAEGGALRSQDLRTSDDPVGLNGAILRIDPNTGAAAAGNPRIGATDPNERRIIAHGARNPFRFTFRPGTNELWWGEVGWGTVEEINRIQDVLGSVENYGWPCYEGTPRQASYNGLGLNMCRNLYDEGAAAHNTPYLEYRHDSKLFAADTCRTGTSSPTGIAFYPSGPYPAAYDDALFFADYSRDCIWAMRAGTNGLPSAANLQTFGLNVSNPVDLTLGPDGNLYYADFNGRVIRRIRFFGTNQPPTADAQATPTSGNAPLLVNFDGRGSSDPEGGTLSYAWDLDNDGAFDDSTSATPSRTYTTPGNVTVRLRVTDPGGETDTGSIVISVNNTPPTAQIVTPTFLTTWAVDESVGFSASATDGEQTTFPSSAFDWEFILHHCPDGCHEHDIEDFEGPSGSFIAPDHEHPSEIELRLTVTDSGGLTDTDSIRIDPRTVDVTMAANMAGAQLTLGQETATAPFTRTVIQGSSNSVSAPEPQAVGSGGADRWFNSWSDGGTQSHNVTANANMTLTATYGDALPPVNSAIPAISGTPRAGSQLSSTTGTWTGSADITYSRQWKSCDSDGDDCADISGANGASYTPADGDVGRRLRVEVTADNPAAGTVSALSNPTAAVAPAPASGYRNAVLATPGLASYWRLGEDTGTVAADEAGANDGAYSNGPLLGQAGALSSDPDTAVRFDGTNDSVVVPDHSSLDWGNEFTIELWVKRTSTSTTRFDDILSKHTGGPLLRFSKNRLTLRKYGAGDVVAANRNTTDTDWHHIAATMAPGGGRLYIDGDDVTGITSTLAIESTDQPLRLAMSSATGGAAPVTLDEVSVYEEALSAATIRGHRDAALATGPPNLPPTADIQASPTSGDPPLAVDFDGTGSSDPESGALSYAWDLDNDGAFDDSTSATPSRTYTASGDVTVRLRVTDPAGGTDVDSVVISVNAAAPVAPANTVLPAISGTSRVGSALSSTTGTWTGTAPIGFTRQWRSCDSAGASCVDISGATGASYTPVEADLGRRLRVAVTADNAAPGTVTAVSDATDAVEDQGTPPASGYRGAVMATSGLVSYWRLGEASGGVAADETGANPGTYSNGPLLAQLGALPSDPDTAVRFDGTNDSVVIPDDPSLDWGNEFTIELWAKRTSTSTTRFDDIVSKHSGGPLLRFSRNRLTLRKYGSGDVLAANRSTTDTDWHHIAATMAPGGGRLYIDGADVTGITSTLAFESNDQPLRLAMSSATGGAAPVTLDEVAVYDTALSAATIGSHLGATAGIAAVNEAPSAVIQAAPLSGDPPLAVDFDATGSSDPEDGALSYAWDLDGDGAFDDSTSATPSRTYTEPGDVTARLRVTDPDGNSDVDSVVISVDEADPVPPANSSLPAISGAPRVSSGLSSTTGTWNGTAPISFARQWRSCDSAGASCVDIPGATGASYTPVEADLGRRLRVAVTADNAAPGTVTAVSAATDPVEEQETSPASGYRDAVMATSGLVSYWRLGETGGTFAADETGANPGAYSNGPLLGQLGALPSDPDTAVRFDGTNDSVVIPDDPSLDWGNEFTIELWAKRTTTSTARFDDMVSKHAGGPLLRFSRNRLTLRKYGSGDVLAADRSTTDTDWHHIAATMGPAGGHLYLDGADVTGITSTLAFESTDQPLRLAMSSATGGAAPVTLDEVAVYDAELSEATVQAHRLAGL